MAVIVETVNNSYVSNGEWVLLMVLFMFVNGSMAGMYAAFWKLSYRGGLLVQWGIMFWTRMLSVLDTAGWFYVARISNGQDQNWQVTMGLWVTAHLFISVGPLMLTHKWHIGAIVVMSIVVSIMIAGSVMMFVAVSQISSLFNSNAGNGPWMGLLTTIVHIIILGFVMISYCSCCRCECIDDVMDDVHAHGDPSGASDAKDFHRQRSGKSRDLIESTRSSTPSRQKGGAGAGRYAKVNTNSGFWRPGQDE